MTNLYFAVILIPNSKLVRERLREFIIHHYDYPGAATQKAVAMDSELRSRRREIWSELGRLVTLSDFSSLRN